jgi:hypothetical protein
MFVSHDEIIFTESAPVVVVFTKYDLLVGTKKAKLKWGPKRLDPGLLDKSSKDAAQKKLDDLVKSITEDMQTPMPRYAKVSSIISHYFFDQSWYLPGLANPDYDADISFLDDITGDLVREKLKGNAADAWMMWAIAQRASLPLKIDACLA